MLGVAGFWQNEMSPSSSSFSTVMLLNGSFSFRLLWPFHTGAPTQTYKGSEIIGWGLAMNSAPDTDDSVGSNLGKVVTRMSGLHKMRLL